MRKGSRSGKTQVPSTSLTFRLYALIIPVVVIAFTVFSYVNARMIGHMLDGLVGVSSRDVATQLAADLALGRLPRSSERRRTWLREIVEANFFITRIDVFEKSDSGFRREMSTSDSSSQPSSVDEQVAIEQDSVSEVRQYRENERLLKVIVPFRGADGRAGCVSLTSSLRQSDLVAQVHDRLALYLIPSAILVLVLMLHFLFMRGIAGRIDRLSRAMTEARSGNLAMRAAVERDDELGRIARSFNDTMDDINRAWQERDRLLDEREQSNLRLRERVGEATRDLETANERLRRANEELFSAQRQLTQSERMAVACQMAAAFAHEIGSPLSAVSTHLQLLAEDPTTTDSARDRVRLIQEQLGRITGYVEELLSETRAGLQPRSMIQVNGVLARLVLFLEQHLAASGVQVRMEFAPDLPEVIASPQQLQQVFLNLVNNACDAMPAGGVLVVATAVEPDKGGRSFVVVRVSDTGTGIPEEKQERIFEPFFTTKELSGGTGLGLSISNRIIRQHGGSIDFTSKAGAGTTFVVRLPVGSRDAPSSTHSGVDFT